MEAREGRGGEVGSEASGIHKERESVKIN